MAQPNECNFWIITMSATPLSASSVQQPRSGKIYHDTSPPRRRVTRSQSREIEAAVNGLGHAPSSRDAGVGKVQKKNKVNGASEFGVSLSPLSPTSVVVSLLTLHLMCRARCD